MHKFNFLCGNVRKDNVIYATKFGQHPWHFFEQRHWMISEHHSLPAQLGEQISSLQKVRSIEIGLSDEQAQHYYDNGKFVFKNTELKTRMYL